METRQGSELEDSMRSTEELLEREQRYGSLLETDKPKSTGISNKVGLVCLDSEMPLKYSIHDDRSDCCREVGLRSEHVFMEANIQ